MKKIVTTRGRLYRNIETFVRTCNRENKVEAVMDYTKIKKLI